jgi:hypothetical protein
MKTLLITCLFAITYSIANAYEGDEKSFFSVDYPKHSFSTDLVVANDGDNNVEEVDQQNPVKKKESVKSVPETKAKSKPERIDKPSARNSRARSGRSSAARSNRSNSSSRGRGH